VPGNGQNLLASNTRYNESVHVTTGQDILLSSCEPRCVSGCTKVLTLIIGAK